MNHFVAYNMPKIDLHCHLDGSMGIRMTKKLLRELGEEYDEQTLTGLLQAPEDCISLAQYLERFDLPIRCLQTATGLRESAKELALDAAKENVKYMEVRFAPSFSTSGGLSVREILEAVREGLLEAEEQADIRTGILVCGMRNLDMETNLAMLKEARELYGYGVVGCDLAGDEKAYPTQLFTEFFLTAKKYGMPFTIHSGECGSRENIKTAIELGAKRLGHGIAMAGDACLMKICAERRIGVELCPTSNLQTKAVTDMAAYPLTEFLEAGVPVSVNTDNRTVSATTSTDEFMRLADAGMMNERMSEQIYQDSVEMSFARDEVKQALLGYLY